MDGRKIGAMVIERFLNNISSAEVEDIQGEKIQLSLGALLVTDETEFAEMYAKVDEVMYECKKEEGNTYRFFETVS